MWIPVKPNAVFIDVFGSYLVAVRVVAPFTKLIAFRIAKVPLLAGSVNLTLPSKPIELRSSDHAIPFDFL